MAVTPAAKNPDTFASSNLAGGNSATGAVMGLPQNQPLGSAGQPPAQSSMPQLPTGPSGFDNYFNSPQQAAPQNNDTVIQQMYAQQAGNAQANTQALLQPQASQPSYAVSADDKSILIGGKSYDIDSNPTAVWNAVNSPDGQQSATTAPPGYKLVPAKLVSGYLQNINHGTLSNAYQGVKELATRAPGAFLNTAGDAAQWAGADTVGQGLNNAGAAVDRFTGADQVPDTLGRGPVGSWFVQTMADAAPMLPIMAASLALPETALPRAFQILGDVGLNMGLFGGQAAQQKKESLLQQGVAPDQANQAGWVDFFTQGGGLMAMGHLGKVASSGTYGAAQQVVAKLQQAVGKGAMTAEQAAAAVTNPAYFARMLANGAGNIGVQGGVMSGMAGASAASNNAYGGQQQDVGDAMLHGLGAGLSFGAVLSPLAGIHSVQDSTRRSALGDALATPDQQIDLLQAVKMDKAAKDIQPEVGALAGKNAAAQYTADTQARSTNAYADNMIAAERAARGETPGFGGQAPAAQAPAPDASRQADVEAAWPAQPEAPVALTPKGKKGQPPVDPNAPPPPPGNPPPGAPPGAEPAAPTADQERAELVREDALNAVGIPKKNKPARDKAAAAMDAGINLESPEAETLVKALKAGKMALADEEIAKLKGAQNDGTSGPVAPGTAGVGQPTSVEPARSVGTGIANDKQPTGDVRPSTEASSAGVLTPVSGGNARVGASAVEKPMIVGTNEGWVATNGDYYGNGARPTDKPVERPVKTGQTGLPTGKVQRAPALPKSVVPDFSEAPTEVKPATPGRLTLKAPKIEKKLTAEQAFNRLKTGLPKYSELTPEQRAVIDDTHAKGELTQENWDATAKTAKETQAKQNRKRVEAESAAEDAKTPEQLAADAAEKTTIPPADVFHKVFGKIFGERVWQIANGKKFGEVGAAEKKPVSEDGVRKSVNRLTAERIEAALKKGDITPAEAIAVKDALDIAQEKTAKRKTQAAIQQDGGDSSLLTNDISPEQTKDLMIGDGIHVQGADNMGVKSKAEKTAEVEQQKAIEAEKPETPIEETRGSGLATNEEVLVQKTKALEEQLQAALKAGDKKKASEIRDQQKVLSDLYKKGLKKQEEKETTTLVKTEDKPIDERIDELNDKIADAEDAGDHKLVTKLEDERQKLYDKRDAEIAGETQLAADEKGDTTEDGRWKDESDDPTESAHVADNASSDADLQMDHDLRQIAKGSEPFKQAIQYAIAKETNKFRKQILTNVLARYEQLKKLGFEFSFGVTEPGRALRGNMVGVSSHTPGVLGEASKVEVNLNGAHMGARSGTNQETLAHELIHSVTQAAISANPEGTAARKLQEFYNELRQDILSRKNANKLNDFEKAFFSGKNNSLENAHELLSWGLTNPKMQEYLASRIDPKGRTWFHRLLDIVANALGLHKVDERSDLARLISVSDELMSEDTGAYVKHANDRGLSFGKQENKSGYSGFALLNKGRGEIVYDKDGLILIRSKNLRGDEIFVPGKAGVGIARVGLDHFTGDWISPADMAKLKDVANSLKTEGAAMVSRNIDKLPDRLQEPARTITDRLNRWTNSGLDKVIFTRDLVKRGVARGLHALETFDEHRESRDALAGHYQKAALNAVEDVRTFSTPEKRTLSEFLQESTLSTAWGYGPKRAENSRAAKLYDALSPRAKRVAEAVFAHGDTILKAKKDAITELADSMYKPMIAEATAAGHHNVARDLEREREGLLKKYNTLLSIGEGQPYVSMQRRGDFVAVGKSDEYLKAEAAANAEDATPTHRALLEKMQTDPNHYLVSEAQSEQEAKALRDNMRAAGFPSTGDHTYYKPKDRWTQEGGGVLAGMARLRNKLDMMAQESTNPADKAQAASMRNLLTHMWLDALSHRSSRKAEMRRVGVHGTMDVVDSFRQSAAADAHFISGIKYNDKMLTALKNARKQADRGEGEERTTNLNLLDEFLKRHEQSTNAVPTPWANKITKATALWQIATSPAHYVGNLMQPWTMTLPYLQAQHGYAKGMNEFFKAYKEIGGILGKTGLLRSLRIEDMPADVRAPMQRLLELGRLDIGMNTEYGSMSMHPKNIVTRAAQAATDRVAAASLKMEALNRLASAAAAYRLEFARTGDAEKALHYAADVVAETHGDHSRANAPRVFNNGFGKVALQFRKFQLVQLTQMAKMIGNLKTADPEERAIAIRHLAYTLAHVGVLGGVIGMPGFSTYSAVSQNLTNMLTGIEGEDWETKIEKAVGDKNVAQLLLRGIPGALGVDLTSKVGYGDMLGIAPYTNVNPADRKSVQDAIGQVTAGPFGGLVGRAAESLHHILVGNYYKGIEGMMPQGIANVMRGARELTNGVTNTKNDKLMNLNAGEAFAEALGFQPSSKSLMQSETGAMIQSTEQFKDRLEMLKERYNNTVQSHGDPSSDIKNLNELRAEMQARGFKPTPLGDMLRAPTQQLIRQIFTTPSGVQYKPSDTGRAAAQFPK